MSRHKCPVTRCGQTIPLAKLMCYAHWRRVPAPLARAVTTAWAGGRGAGTEALRHAQDAALAAVQAKIAAKAATS